MKLRLAKKIMKTIDTPREKVYNQYQYDNAFRRISKTKSHKDDNQFFQALCNTLIINQRAKYATCMENSLG